MPQLAPGPSTPETSSRLWEALHRLRAHRAIQPLPHQRESKRAYARRNHDHLGLIVRIDSLYKLPTTHTLPPLPDPPYHTNYKFEPVIAQPLYVTNVSISDANHNIVLVRRSTIGYTPTTRARERCCGPPRWPPTASRVASRSTTTTATTLAGQTWSTTEWWLRRWSTFTRVPLPFPPRSSYPRA